MRMSAEHEERFVEFCSVWNGHIRGIMASLSRTAGSYQAGTCRRRRPPVDDRPLRSPHLAATAFAHAPRCRTHVDVHQNTGGDMFSHEIIARRLVPNRHRRRPPHAAANRQFPGIISEMRWLRGLILSPASQLVRNPCTATATDAGVFIDTLQAKDEAANTSMMAKMGCRWHGVA